MRRRFASFQAKERLWPNPPQFLKTMAEGIKLQQCGQITFPILCDHAEPNVISVTDRHACTTPLLGGIQI